MIRADYLTEGLQRVFEDIHRTRMAGIPLLNPALRVQCVGFRPWGDEILGVLITPWFLNLMLLPSEADKLDECNIGEKQTRLFSSGAYEFIVGEETGVGRYLSCSLFSPMFEFEDQAAAVAVAGEVFQALMDEGNRDTVSMREQEIARIWRGEEEPPVVDEEQEPLMERRMSRRDLLRGRFAAPDQGNSEP